MKTMIALAATAAAIVAAAPASAELYNFNLTGTDDFGNVESASFSLDSNVIPDYAASGVGFIVYNVSGSFDYAGYTTDVEDLIFYNANYGGGFYSGDLLISTTGPQLYTGDETAPTFLTGTFSLTDYFVGGDLTLTITPAVTPPAGVPEPATWAMMIGGFGLVGGTMRYRRAKTGVSFAG